MKSVRDLPEDERAAVARRCHDAYDADLPELSHWNSSPCPAHTELNPLCMDCGVEFRRHQRVAVLWLYFAMSGLLADSVGLGKTFSVAGLLALLKETGELDTQNRSLIVCRAAAVLQWRDQLRRVLPTTSIATAMGTKAERIERYLSPWEVMIISQNMLVSRSNDLEKLLNFPVRTVIADDIDALLNPANKTAYAVKRLARDVPRAIPVTATPLQKRLPQLHSILEMVGGHNSLGSLATFRRRYIITEPVIDFHPRTGRMIRSKRDTGVRNLLDLKERLAPMALRRTAVDVDDVDLPVVQPATVWLDLTEAQRAKYEELRAGVLRVITSDGINIKRAVAQAAFLYGQQICGGLAGIGEADGPGASSKLDWLEDKLTDGDLSDEKAVAFIHFRSNLRAMMDRLTRAGIHGVVIWGEERDPQLRHDRITRFREDPNCRVLLGTTSIEQSLNLQVARHLVYVDTILNPARMEQLIGRIRRDGSPWGMVFAHHLLARATQEERYLPQLEREQALADYVWDERSELFPTLTPLALMEMIAA